MDNILTAIICGFTNAARGQAGLAYEAWGFKISSRIVAALICGCAIGLSSDASGLEAILLFGTVLLMLSFGWGKYFMVGHGLDMRHEKEFYPADVICDLINPKSNYLYGFIGMFIRWALTSIPLFYLTAGVWAIPVAACFGFCIAGWYWFAGLLGRKAALANWIRFAELTSGFMLGLAI